MRLYRAVMTAYRGNEIIMPVSFAQQVPLANWVSVTPNYIYLHSGSFNVTIINRLTGETVGLFVDNTVAYYAIGSASDGDDLLYIMYGGGNKLTRMTPNGSITRGVQIPFHSLLALVRHGNFLFTSDETRGVRKIDLQGNLIAGYLNNYNGTVAGAVAFDGTYIYANVSNGGVNQIHKLDYNLTLIATYTSPFAFNYYSGNLIFSNGNVFQVVLAQNRIVKFNVDTGSFSEIQLPANHVINTHYTYSSSPVPTIYNQTSDEMMFGATVSGNHKAVRFNTLTETFNAIDVDGELKSIWKTGSHYYAVKANGSIISFTL